LDTSSFESFPTRLKRYREDNQWTQKQLGEFWHVSPETISAWEHGRRKPDIQLVSTLARDLQMEESELIAYISVGTVKSKENRDQGTGSDDSFQNSVLKIFQSQQDCEPFIREAARQARTIKILTIRGDKYFIGTTSWLHSVVVEGQARVEVLVLSPEAAHITEDLAEKLQHKSAEEIKRKMRMSLDYLKSLAGIYKNFSVRCYHQRPNFKILIFDDLMFISSFARKVPKNDQSAEMMMLRQGNALFAGFEELYDEWLERSSPLE
jgi:transcriptional regulator with XRE-family HTH domain